MSSDPNNNQDSSSSGRRRSSFVDLFASRPVNPQPNAPRRLSITTLGLSTASNQPATPYGTLRGRTESISSANSNSVDESPFEDEPSATFSPTTTSTSPFARRMSFGAKALGGPPRTASSGSSPQMPQNEGFDFAENMRQRAERGSISGLPPSFGQPGQSPPHLRAKSMASVEAPPRELPKQQKGPDAFQERILKGDFYMD